MKFPNMDNYLYTGRNGSAIKGLSFFRDYAGKKWPLRGSQHADYLYRSQVSGVRFQYLTFLSLTPEH